MPTQLVNDASLYCETIGEGLSRFYRVIACVVRRHGRPEKPPGPYSVAQFACDAADLLLALDVGPAHICGLSMGGMIAFQMQHTGHQSYRCR